MSIPWNTVGGIPYSEVPGANLGAVSFAVLDSDRVAFLCNGVSQIRVFSVATGEMLQALPVAPAPRDLVFSDDQYYVLYAHHVTVYSSAGEETRKLAIPEGVNDAWRIAATGAAVQLWRANGSELTFTPNGTATETSSQAWTMPDGSQVYSAIVEGQADVVLFREGMEARRRFSMANKVAGVFPIGTIDDKVILDVQTYVSENPVAVERFFMAIEIDVPGSTCTLLRAPDSYFAYTDRDIYQNQDGELFHIISTPRGVHVYQLTLSESGALQDYPMEIRTLHYHYNDHLIKVD